MNVLSIGNSYSQDAHRYLSRIARADGVDLKTANLYIGGCGLSMHHRNMLADAKAYVLEVNGEGTGFKVTMKEALLNRDWDVITLQQASRKSVDYATYQPYLDNLVEFVKECVPKAKIVLHQTWGYNPYDPKLMNEMGYNTHAQMFADVKKAVSEAAKHIKADYVIPAGDVMCKLVEAGLENTHRDNIHVSFGIGRYALGLIWYMTLTGNDIADNTFADFDEEVTAEEIAIAKKSAKEVFDEYKKA